MKKYVLLILFAFILIGSANAQYFLNWANYDVMNPGSDVTRSLIYNRHTDHVLVATRKYEPPVVVILDAATGDSIGVMDTNPDIINGGTYPLNMVGIADDGTIYMCNLSAPQYTPNSTLKIYRYQNENASPDLVFDDALEGARYGDSFAAVGSGENIYLYCSGMGNPKMAVVKDDGGSAASLEKYIDLPLPGAARHGISPVFSGGQIWINGADNGSPPPQLINHDGTVIAVVPDSLASPGGTSCIDHLILGQYNLITVANAWSVSFRAVEYFVDELGTVTFDYFGHNSDSLPLIYNGNTFVNNINATAALDYDSKRHSIISLFGYNSVASMSMDSLLKASTPRADTLTISVDGKNDFFPTDHVGTSNGRDLYFTWSEGKVFFGITGHTLIDPNEKNRLYVAFDLDPSEANGSNTPPEDAGGVGALPFKADVVYMVEPWNAADYLIGSIYKWSGSEWTEFLFDGNMANQGALAYADEGERRLAELAAIKNANGIGSDFTDISVMVYVAETGVSGEVLCAFPSGNRIGNGVSFGQYYYADSLGSGMFPTDTNYVKIRGFATSVKENRSQNRIAQNYRLSQNYPNPFNASTVIEYSLPKMSQVRIEIYNITGRLVKKLVDSTKRAGNYRIKFSDERLSSGVYFYKLIVNNEKITTRKMLLLK